MFKKIYPVVTLLVLSLTFVSWGWLGHQTISGKCPESFPASMAGFSVWGDSLALHGSDADNRKGSDSNESPKHYIDIDSYAEFNSTGRIASTYDSIVKIHGSGFVINNGTLPWATLNMYDTLVVDFRKLKWHKAMLDASDLGHYVGDGHMPLHLTENYDGRMTGQSGIHSRYESTMVSNYISQLSNYSGDSIHFINNVNKYIFDYIYTNYHYVDSVLAADTYAMNQSGNNTSAQYYAALWSKTHFTTTLFHNASHSLAELIYSAWIEAGRPPFYAKTVSNSIINTPVDNISVYPNPTQGIVNLKGNSVFKTDVFDMTGKLLEIYTDNQFDLSNLSNGIYILSIYSKEGKLTKEKVLLAK
ncbi:MAG: T9SS type A sorting domain-containing protein [Paludibacter sp.]